MADEIGLFEAIYTMRAIRRQRPDLPVTDEQVHAIIEAGTQAPNGGNAQPCRFIVVRDQETKDKIGVLYKDSVRQILIDPSVSGNKAEWHLGDHLADSPVILFVYVAPVPDHQGNPRVPTPASSGMQAFPAVQNMLLAARGLGLGSNLTTAINAFHGQELKDILGVPDDCEFGCMLPIGYPVGKHGPKTRRPVEEVTYSERWGNPVEFNMEDAPAGTG